MAHARERDVIRRRYSATTRSCNAIRASLYCRGDLLCNLFERARSDARREAHPERFARARATDLFRRARATVLQAHSRLITCLHKLSASTKLRLYIINY